MNECAGRYLRVHFQRQRQGKSKVVTSAPSVGV
jgi:hypothetical protein